MYDKTKYPYTAAYHIFHSLFPVTTKSVWLLEDDQLTQQALNGQDLTDNYNLNLYRPHNVSIAQMAMILERQGKFTLHDPRIYAKDIYQILADHLERWRYIASGYIKHNPDLMEDLNSFVDLGNFMYEMAKHYNTPRVRVFSEFSKSVYSGVSDYISAGSILAEHKRQKELVEQKHVPSYTSNGMSDLLR